MRRFSNRARKSVCLYNVRMLGRITSLGIVLLCSFAVAQTKPSPDDGPWHKVKSASGHTKSKPVMVKFQVGTPKWRLTFKSTADKDTTGRSNPSSSIRVALMTATILDVEGKPANWSQVDVICNGKPGDPNVKIYSNGLDKDGKEKWFQLVITGYVSEYEVMVEDQSADDAAKAAKTKKKKKGDD